MGESKSFVLSGDHQIDTELGTIHFGLLPKICSDSSRGDVFALSSCFIRTSEGIWFCLSRAICVSVIMFSQSILGVFFLRLLSSPDLSPGISLFALLCRSESPAPAPAEPRSHILVCRCTDAGKKYPGAPHGDADPLRFPSQGSGQARGPSRLPAQVTEGPNIPKMRLQTGMKRSV